MKRQRLTMFLALFCLTSIFHLAAQPQMQPLPVDPKVRYGTLENGLTYYIRHNELPKERAEFFIAQKVGAVLEEDNQNGLAHFLEHMAFNGTKNLPGKAMTNYLEKIGVKFGENLNAYTSFDRTVYNVSNVPVTREGIIDTCLLILHDWSSFISLDAKEIDSERGVIREEMRSGQSASRRMMEDLLPQLMPGSQYAKRNIIGTPEIILNFKHQELRDYYHKWYRPDLQGIIIIGDIDVDQVEAKIKKMFADIPKPVNPAERTYYPVPKNVEPIVGIASDKEATATQISIFFKHDQMPKEAKATIAGLAMDFVNGCISRMLNDRFSEIVQKANPPFISAYGYDGTFYTSDTEDAFTFYANAKENEAEKALKGVTTEIERMKRFGFTASEFERAKTNVLKSYETAFNERDKQRNRNYAQEYVTHFTLGGAIPGIEVEHKMINQIAPFITVDQINQAIKTMIGDENIVISISAPQKEGLTLPTKEQLLTWFNEARKADVQAYVDNVSTEPLMAQLPKPGKVVSTEQDAKFGATVYTMSNGVKVVVKTTKFKDDEIQMSATSPGGSSHFTETEYANMALFTPVVGVGGLGSFSRVELGKVLTGKRVSCSPSVGPGTEGFNGSSSVKDFETMLQLTHLWFTAPRMDEEAYQSFVSRVKSQLESAEIDPNNALSDTIPYALYQNPARFKRLKAEDLKTLNYQTIMNWYKDRYKDASDFTFVLVGNIEPEAVKPLLEQYLGSLPSINRKEARKDFNGAYRKGAYKNTFNKKMQTPKATVFDCFTGVMDYTLANRTKMDMFTQILRIVYTEKVREDEGGTYGVNVSGSISNYPKGNSIVQIFFQTNEEKKEMLNNIVISEFKNMAEKGPRQEDFSKVKEFMIKKQSENEQENNYWNSQLLNYYNRQESVDNYTTYLSTLNAITPADIKQFAKTLLSQGNSIEIIMNGVKSE